MKEKKRETSLRRVQEASLGRVVVVKDVVQQLTSWQDLLVSF